MASIDRFTFSGRFVNVNSNNPDYSHIGGVLFNKTVVWLIGYHDGKIISYRVPSTVASIREAVFSYYPIITSTTIPSSVTSIGSSAFYSCSKLTSVTYKGTSNPGASSLNVFYNCDQLTAVNVPSDYVGDTFCGRSVIKATKKFTPFIQSVYNRVLYFMKLVNCYILFLI